MALAILASCSTVRTTLIIILSVIQGLILFGVLHFREIDKGVRGD